MPGYAVYPGRGDMQHPLIFSRGKRFDSPARRYCEIDPEFFYVA